MLDQYKGFIQRNRNVLLFILVFLIIIFLGWVFKNYLFSVTEIQPSSSSKKILYWVDPMEPQIHYNAPGKSRMNMDLVPVYEDDTQDSTQDPSSPIKISSAIINNLGVRLALVEEGTLSPVIRSFGTIKAAEDKIAHIHPYVEGFIEKLHTKLSQQFVEKDQPLFDIYSSELRFVQKEYLLSSTSKMNINPDDGFVEKLRSLRIPEKQIEQLKKTRKESSLVTIYAPQAGYIDSLNIREGMWVEPETTIMSLTDLSEVWVIAEIFPSQLAFVKPGLEVKVYRPQSPNQYWQGTIDYLYPVEDPQSLATKVRIKLHNPDLLLKPNTYVAVEIKLSFQPTLKLPKEAVIWSKDQQHVIVALGDGKFQPRQVVTGMEDESHIQIISGLKKGETVVTSAQFLLDSEISLKSALQRLDSSPDNSPVTPHASHGEGHPS